VILIKLGKSLNKEFWREQQQYWDMQRGLKRMSGLMMNATWQEIRHTRHG
jgi:hypothetical protein